MEADALLAALWNDIDGDPDDLAVSITGPDVVLPSVFDVTGWAAATVAAANLAVAELASARSGAAIPAVTVDRHRAAAAFSSERLLRADGWDLPPVWDPVAGDYRCADGWIRLHTNYRHHLDAVLAVLGVTADREAVAAAVTTWAGDGLEQAVVDAGGCAAALRTIDEWRAHPAGRATVGERPVVVGAPVSTDGGCDLRMAVGSAPLDGVRVLDLTRVIAGPVATGFLAAHGAEVLRIDPPGFAEVAALLPITTAGKRCAALDLRSTDGRDRFIELAADAHVVVWGFRPGAMAGLGLEPEALRSANPALITVCHDAYGWRGPWAGRRGFDSLVQMSCGIAAAGSDAAGADHPVPLPAQALDHGTGFLLAAATCRALTRLVRTGATAEVRGSLIGSADVLTAMRGDPGSIDAQSLAWSPDDTESADTAWGPVRRVPVPGTIEGHPAHWSVTPGPLGRHPAAWSDI